MSKYTIELRFLCENLSGLSESKGYNSIAEIIEKSRRKIFSFDYPIYDATYKSVLETKFIKHFYTREISEETFGLWQLRLDEFMNLKMPYYNKLYAAIAEEFNPFWDTNLTTTSNRDTKGSASGSATSKGSGSDYTLYSDTPQGGINGLDQEKYLTNATKNKLGTQQDSSSKQNSTSTDEYLERKFGKAGGMPYYQMLKDYADKIISVDEALLDEAEKLFIGIW